MKIRRTLYHLAAMAVSLGLATHIGGEVAAGGGSTVLVWACGLAVFAALYGAFGFLAETASGARRAYTCTHDGCTCTVTVTSTKPATDEERLRALALVGEHTTHAGV